MATKFCKYETLAIFTVLWRKSENLLQDNERFPTHFSVSESIAGVSKSTTHNICCKYARTGELGRDRQIVFRERTKVVDNVLQHIEFYKLREPSIYLHEIRRNLIADNVCTIETVPSLRSTHQAVTKYLNMRRNKLSSVAAEPMTPANEQRVTDFSHRNCVKLQY